MGKLYLYLFTSNRRAGELGKKEGKGEKGMGQPLPQYFGLEPPLHDRAV